MPRWLVLRLTAVHDRDASDRLLPPITLQYAHPYSSAPGSSSGFSSCVYLTDCVRQHRGIERFHDARIASWIAGLVGEYSSHTARSLMGFRPRRPTLTPLSLPSLRAHSAISRRAARGEGGQDRFHIARRDACDAWTIRDAFPRQVIPDSACPLQVTDREPSPEP